MTKEVFLLALEQLIPELPEVINSAKTRYERERGNVLAQAAGGEEWLEERDNTEVEEILRDIYADTAITAPDPGEISPWATTTDARLAWCRYVDNRYRARVRARGVLTTHREPLPGTMAAGPAIPMPRTAWTSATVAGATPPRGGTTADNADTMALS